jgi:hypothetical protein
VCLHARRHRVAASARRKPASRAKNRCATSATLNVPGGLPQWNGWGASPTQQRFSAGERARLSADAVPKLDAQMGIGFPALSQAGRPAVGRG